MTDRDISRAAKLVIDRHGEDAALWGAGDGALPPAVEPAGGESDEDTLGV